jgi:membrane protease YdiL (CAAX protease family)
MVIGFQAGPLAADEKGLSMAVTTPRVQSSRPMSLGTLVTFFIATFVLSWGMGVLLTVFPDQSEALFGPMGYTNPAFILIVYTPGIVAVVLVVRHYGIRGLGQFLRRLTLWRMKPIWWLTLLVGMPAVFYAGAALKGTLGDPFPYAPWYAVLPALLTALFIGPIEELGWRGVALPLLQRRFAPLYASLIVGGVAAVWHIPAFFMSGTKQSAWALGPFLLGVVAISVILTAMFNASRGSLLVAVVFHAQMNGPAWPDAQPWDMYLFAAVAVVVVLVNRKSMLSRGVGATAVVLDEEVPAAVPRTEPGDVQPSAAAQSSTVPSAG